MARGLSGNVILNALRASGSGARRRDVQSIVRTIKGQQRSGVAVRNTRLDRRSDPSRMAVSEFGRMRKEFTYKVELLGTDADGNEIKRGIMVTTDNLHTRGEIERRARLLLRNEKADYGIDVESMQIVSAVRKGGQFELGI